MISVVIPQYKGKEKLYTNLKKNLPFLAGCEVIVVNDYPEVPLTNEVKELFPEVVVVENEKNLGFAGAVSEGIKRTKHPFVFLLNNDVVLLNDSYKKGLIHFEKNPDLFAVSFKQIEKDGGHVGRNTIFWSHGFFRHTKADAGTHGINGWAEGGSMLFDKKKYHTIHGFDINYSPFYWEDIDLSYRAWKAGYEIQFDSSILVEHHHESTIATYFQKTRIDTIAYRNQIMTIWKNISDPLYFAEHVFYLFKNLLVHTVRGHYAYAKGLGMACTLLPDILKKRKAQWSLWRRTDRKIFEMFK